MHTDNTQSHPRRRHVREQRKSKAPGDRARPASGPARRAGFALGLSLSPRLTARGVTVRNPGPITPASPHTGRPRPAGADPLRWTPPRGGAGAAHAPRPTGLPGLALRYGFWKKLFRKEEKGERERGGTGGEQEPLCPFRSYDVLRPLGGTSLFHAICRGMAPHWAERVSSFLFMALLTFHETSYGTRDTAHRRTAVSLTSLPSVGICVLSILC